MDPLSKLSRSLGIARRGERETTPGAVAKASQRTVRASPRSAISRSELSDRIRATGTEDLEAREACLRLVVNYMLAQEFGVGVIETKAMQQTVDEVQRVLATDANIKSEFDALVRGLAESQ